jgi:hypothetical protein
MEGKFPNLLRTPYVLYGKHLHISKSEQGVANLLCLILIELREIQYNNLAFATKSDFFCPDPGVFCGQMRPIFQTVQYFRLLKIFFVPFGHKPCGHENPLLWPKAAVKSIGLTTKYN